ncbi:MAG TPA: hypothetical protein VME23_04100 [Terracidiphilus sp.]|nr:hypothetical protein [Terracidiphilus sp.]
MTPVVANSLKCLAILFVAVGAGRAQSTVRELVVTRQLDHPVLTTRSAGAEGNKYGFEGGRVIKQDGVYHLFTSEMVGDPHWVRMKLAHWTSLDGADWRRVGTLRESSGDFTGKDPRAALWSPMPVFDADGDRWNLFYVAYQAAPDTSKQWLTNHEGRIWRAVSQTPGRAGIGGPYKDVGIVLERGKDSDSWEGLQGTDSFFPYKVGTAWYALYGSARTESLPITLWQVGLAQAARIGGPWKRCSDLNPLGVEPTFIENPIVSRLDDGSYIAIYDSHKPNSIGYTFSSDGIHWSPGSQLAVQTGSGVWATEVRTPLGLIDEGNGRFTLFYSANERIAGAHADANGIVLTPGSVGMVDVRLKSRSSSQETAGRQ